jgi:2-methylisocitrate lyase-like PEP mutase family enzyme
MVRGLDGVPLNILHTPAGPPVAHLADLGVRRISLGSLLYRRAIGAAVDAALAVRAGRPLPDGTTPSYAQIQRTGRQDGSE